MKTDVNKSSLTDEDFKDLELFQRLKPFLHKCLTLNHDLNNPLAGIIGYGEFLMEDSEQILPEHLEYIKRMLVCAERMENIIGELCEVKGKLGQEVDLRTLTDEFKKIADEQS